MSDSESGATRQETESEGALIRGTCSFLEPAARANFDREWCASTAYDGRVLARLKSMFKGPKLAGPPVTLQKFSASDRPITESGITTDDGGWRIEAREAGSIRLFEVAEPGVDRCVLTYRAELRAADLEPGAYLELWCRFPGRGEFFSKGLQQKAKGTLGWSSFEVTFTLKAEERPDLVRLNIVFEGQGTLWMRNLELQEAPLP